MNALGAPVKDVNDNNDAVTMSSSSLGRSAQSYTLGTCSDVFEFFAPDKNGDPNSTRRFGLRPLCGLVAEPSRNENDR